MLPPIRAEDGRVSTIKLNDSLLRRWLFRWAARFTPYERIQSDLVERTISETLQEFPEAGDDSTIDVQLLATMRRLTLQEFGIQYIDTDERATSEGPSDLNDDQ